MKDTPKYGATFTLLYDDPEMPVEHPYLRPSYQHSFRAQRCRHGRHVTGARATSGAHGEAPYASFSGAGCERPQPVFAGAALGPPLGLERMMPSITSIAESAGTSTGEGRPPLLHVRPDGAPSLTTLQDVLGSGSTGDVHRSEANTNEELFRALEYYPSPDSRSGHLLVACSERESIILHGGLNADDVFHNDTWEYHVRTRRWKELKCRASSAPTAMTASPQREPSVGPSPTEMWSSTPSTAFHTPYSSVSPSREYLSSMPRWSSFVDLDDEMDLQEPNPENFPPAAHGQSGSIYHNADNEVCLFVMGGITAEETCSSTAFSLNLSSGIWTRLEMAVQFPMMWGSTVQTMQQPRRSSPRDDATTADGVDEDEEVVVMFGGMTVAGKVVADTWILHLSAPLTAAELSEDPDTYLDGIMYDVIEKERVRAYLDETGSLPPISVLGEDEDEIHLQHQNLIHDWKKHNRHTLQSWRREMLRCMVGKYWIEQITKTNDLLGRRRPSSSVFRRYFMFIFGGRDEAFFFNDFWVFNICTHTWVQVRLDVPRYWLAKFFNEPHNAEVGTYLSELLAEIRENKLMEAYRLFSPESRQAENTFDSLRTLREVLYASSSNSTARPRTGSCMALDPERELLFVYGGLGFNRRQYGTLGDLHVYNIREHTWYEVKHLKHRRWCAETDMWQSSILHVDPLADAMEHQCSLDPKPLDGTRTADGSTAALSVAEYVSHYGRRTRQQEGAAPSAAARVPKEEAYPPTPLAIRGGWWWTSPQVQPVQPTTGLEVDVEYFHLPVVTPYHRTMAALVADPIAPGRRFFLFGGRVSQFTYGDLLEMRVDLVGPQDLEYEDMQCKVCLPSKNPEFQPTSASIALQRWYRGGQLSEDSGNLGGVLRQSHRTQGAPHRAHERGTLKSAVVHWFQDLVCVRDTACMARVARVAPPAPNSTQCSGFGPHMSRLSSPAGSMASPSRVTWDGGASSANNPSATAEDIWRWRNNDSRVLPRSIMVRRAPIPASQWLAERTRKLVGASEYLRATLHDLLTSAGLAEDTGMNTLNDVRGFDDERPPLSVEGTPQSKRLSDACLKRLTRCVDVSGPAQRRNFSFCFGHAPFKDSNENRKINCMIHALMVLIFTAKKSDDFIFMDGEP